MYVPYKKEACYGISTHKLSSSLLAERISYE